VINITNTLRIAPYFRHSKFKKLLTMNLDQSKATVIDVRERFELLMGKIEGSVNIPLGNIPTSLEQLRAMSKPLVFVCASGNRSGQVVAYLQSLGWTEVYNGGGWKSYEQKKAA
jgi:rhodanese-related sulfurtransferase